MRTLYTYDRRELYGGVWLTYLPVNAAYAVYWNQSLLKLFNSKNEAEEYIRYLTHKEKTDG